MENMDLRKLIYKNKTINKKCGCIHEIDNYGFIPTIEIKHECPKHKSARIEYLRQLMEKRKQGKLY